MGNAHRRLDRLADSPNAARLQHFKQTQEYVRRDDTVTQGRVAAFDGDAQAFGNGVQVVVA